MNILRWAARNFHYYATILLALALLPLLRLSHIPFRYDMKLFGLAYLLVGLESVFFASLLYLVLVPGQLMQSFIGNLERHRVRIVMLVLYFIVLLWTIPILKVMFVMVATAAFLEIVESNKSPDSRRKAFRLIGPCVYLFIGLLLISSYNDIILSLRRYVDYDLVFYNMDRWLLRGGSISLVSHWAIRTFSLSFFSFLEFVYYSLFPIIGVGLIYSSIGYDPQRGMRFVGTILTGYYITLAIFYFWPSLGPYYLCRNHFSLFPHQFETYTVEKQVVQGALARWSGAPLKVISFEYYIAFPSMHIAESLIVLWFLRRWKRAFVLLTIYNVLVSVAIVFLEWHYLVDVLAGIVVAAIAIATADLCSQDFGNQQQRLTTSIAAAER